MTIKFKKLSEKAIQPTRTTDSGAGYNLAVAQITTEVNERGQLILVYHSGVSVEIPEGYEGYLRPSDSICSKTLRMCSTPIVGDFDAEVVARFMTTTDVIPAVYKEGEIFAQLVINKIEDVEFIEYIDTTKDEQSAPMGPQSLPETEGEPNNSETTNGGSGEAQSGLEQA